MLCLGFIMSSFVCLGLSIPPKNICLQIQYHLLFAKLRIFNNRKLMYLLFVISGDSCAFLAAVVKQLMQGLIQCRRCCVDDLIFGGRISSCVYKLSKNYQKMSNIHCFLMLISLYIYFFRSFCTPQVKCLINLS